MGIPVYTDAQVQFIKTLLVVEKCTYPQITALTGIQHGSISNLASKTGARSVHKRKPGKTRLAKILEARKLVDLRAKYARELAEHFAQTKPDPK